MASKSVFRAQIPVRVQGNTSCVHHHGTELTLCCWECSELACIRCIASVHDGHILDSLSDVMASKKGNIQSFIDQTEQNDIVDLKTEVETIAEKIENNERKFQMHQDEIEKQGKRMKDEIDIVVKKSISRCTELKQENEKRLKKYKIDMEARIKDLNTLVLKCRDTLQTQSDVEIFDTEKQLGPLPAVELNLCHLTFTPNKQPQGYLDLAVGKLTTVGYQFVYAYDAEENECNTPMEKMAQLKEEVQRKAPYNVSAICANKDEGAWICSSEVSSIYQINDEVWRCGTGCFKVCVSDISVSPVTGNVWASSEVNNAIMELPSQGEPIKRLTTTSAPRCLCVTQEGNIVIGMTRKLVRCDVRGNVLLTRTVCTPTKVAACPVTGNIAVVELDLREHEGEGRPHILVLDRLFQEYHRYHGDREDKGTTPESSTSKAFHPIDITFDSAGNLLVGDYGNNSILIINTTGEVESIYSDSWHVVAISINSKGSVWAVFRYQDYPNYKIKVLKPMY
ncbi:uncharacterized protein LOC110465400 [Mizuhopecten yessoensis]|uniref:B box-type domain-containing protein n=1 Tax=Mizuhopecten yessoensis TaxID=6573 RepID=A0A210PRQ9_MIZYE|nr:uncharacterized protein LOC110465400 [Mizuhopecten yessoensis]OWF39168.1 hypothetical protein KP79_PYT07171 [Mizuhopecten yessoensis]